MSFGFSISDVITSVALGFKVCTTIRESPAEHASLVRQLDVFRGSLEGWKNCIAGLELTPSTVESVEKQLLICSELFQRLDETIARCMKGSRSHGGLYKRRENMVGELKWAAYERDKIMRLRDDFNSEISSLESLLHIYNTRMVQENNVILARIENSPRESLDEWPDFKPIRFIDALDRRCTFPFERCETWGDFQDLLKLSFKDSVGKSWVDAGRYQVADETTGNILAAKGWEDRIKPGMTVSMAMLLLKREDSNPTEHKCPACGSPYGNATGTVLERVRCKRCATWFQISSQPRIKELGGDDNELEELDISAGNKQLVQSKKADAAFDTDEIRFFRRLQVLLEIPESMNIIPKWTEERWEWERWEEELWEEEWLRLRVSSEPVGFGAHEEVQIEPSAMLAFDRHQAEELALRGSTST